MKTRLLIIFSLVGFLSLLTFIPDSEALRESVSLEQMIERSDVIVIGTVQSTWVDIRPFDEQKIVDTAKIKVDEWLKNKKNPNTIEIRYYGYWAKTIENLVGLHRMDLPIHQYETGQQVLVHLSHEDSTMVMGEGYYPFYEGGYIIKDDVAISQIGEQIELNKLYETIDITLENKSNESLQVIDSLTIPNAERDVKLAAGYKLYPGVGWVHPDDQGNLQPIYRDNPNNPGELVLDIDAMIAESETNFHPCQQLSFDAFTNTTLKQTPSPNSTLSVGYGDGENEDHLRSVGCFENRHEWQTQEFLDYVNGLIENEN